MHTEFSILGQFRVVKVISLALLLTGFAHSLQADIVIEHFASVDPVTEGFLVSPFNVAPESTVGPVSNDLGRDAWAIIGTGQSSQFAYEVQPLTAGQLAAINASGFTLTFDARVIQNLAPTYNEAQAVITIVEFCWQGTRYEIDLGLDSNGDTVVILPDCLDAGGPGGSVRATGASFVVPGNDYHSYQLVFDRQTGTADFFIDGDIQFTGYAGHTCYPTDGLYWAVVSGGQGNFNRVRLTIPDDLFAVVPENFSVSRGTYVSGGLGELAENDNADLSLQRATSDIQSRTEFNVTAVSPVASPFSLEVTLKGSVFARSLVNQTIELFDYVAGSWEQVDTRAASRFSDSSVTVGASGDLSRFVEAGTMAMAARIRYQSPVARQRFSSNTDQFIWTIGQ